MSESVLTEAERIINGDRRQDYGTAEESFGRIAALWGATLGIPITGEQVCLCMIQLKIARYVNGRQRDSIVDIAGYAGCLDTLREGAPA